MGCNSKPDDTTQKKYTFGNKIAGKIETKNSSAFTKGSQLKEW